MKKVREKFLLVKDYQAEAVMKLNIPFLQVPDSKVSVYYKQPDKFKIKQQKGISVVPKGGISINLNAILLNKDYTIIDAGTTILNNATLRVVKLLPIEESAEVVLSTFYIDPKDFLVRKASATTRENGTYEMEFMYKKYSKWALPDEVIFSFNTKDYKLPKGITFDYEEEEKPQLNKLKNAKGKVIITYNTYTINKGVPSDVFSK